MSERLTARALLEELESVSSDAWGCVPGPGQALELWRCIWERDDSHGFEMLGDAMVTRPTRIRVRNLAEASNQWWCWTLAGDPFAVKLAGAQAMFREGVPEMSADAAAEYLRELSATLDETGKRAVGKAIAALKRG